MKKLFVFFCLVLFVAGLAAGQVSRGGTLFVSIRTVELKSGTGWFASTRGRLNYGDRVTVIQVSGKFVEVRSATNTSLTGWTASANFSTRPVVAGTTGTATASEVALAGKGFNQEVEDSFRSQQNLNYADVDRVEAITVDMNALRRFLEEGRLSLGDN
ncbi:MAG: hypothetical protein LBC80_03305 [Treponema sp.]|jgi:uncharacterized protein YgiM (DUF1202 family)|nr:hypothetical protein [Treponema sp.]